MKSYRQLELKMYCVALILMYFLITGEFVAFIEAPQGQGALELIAGLLDCAVVSSTIYIFIYILDSTYASDLKWRLVYLFCPKPGEVIFTRIFKRVDDTRFSEKDIQMFYGDILEVSKRLLIKKKQRSYENQQWYHIYHQYRGVEIVETSATDSRLCRDIFVATINTVLLYLMLSLWAKVMTLDCRYLLFLLGALVLSNIAARLRGMRWVYNVIAYDLAQKRKNSAGTAKVHPRS